MREKPPSLPSLLRSQSRGKPPSLPSLPRHGRRFHHLHCIDGEVVPRRGRRLPLIRWPIQLHNEGTSLAFTAREVLSLSRILHNVQRRDVVASCEECAISGPDPLDGAMKAGKAPSSRAEFERECCLFNMKLWQSAGT